MKLPMRPLQVMNHHLAQGTWSTRTIYPSSLPPPSSDLDTRGVPNISRREPISSRREPISSRTPLLITTLPWISTAFWKFHQQRGTHLRLGRFTATCLQKGPPPPNLTSKKSGQLRPPAKYCDNMQYEPTGVQGVHEA